ncbi:hypothetical protein [Corynebacterium urealyticum]|uniref:Transposase n=1 Tax=Corynebacterium urealyticum (strain ATCC 43042 / DSM 7109) TaxID=504474 RepID=B1VGV6_CORU7|nr:hypothetical protein [Corynebacterium urealyticum]AGE36989.1 hypothetical protein CU7111_1403 [Corynebacterium urealyticum DSM 7111]WOH93952.1 hypothetical protein RZ943_07750 [Corynebacterium urealyticum]CAQ05413.1 hypothetical protein cu1453 [Corynebacterium urealyticum DSM 7109]SNV88405.1 transposase for insertion sequence [Corynebacterium urealyticum]
MVNHKLIDKLMHQMDLRAKLHQRRPYVSYTGTVSHLDLTPMQYRKQALKPLTA